MNYLSTVQFCAYVWLKRNSFLMRACVCVCVCVCYYTKTLAAEFISCSSRFLSRRRACSKLCSSTPNLTSIPVISLLICDIAFFILTSGAARNTKKHNVQTCNKTNCSTNIFIFYKCSLQFWIFHWTCCFISCWKKPVFLSEWHFFTSHWWNASQINFNIVIPAGYKCGWNNSFNALCAKINL